MACSMGDVVPLDAAADWQVATMIVNAQALTLEKLLAVPVGLKPGLQSGPFSQTHQVGQDSLAVTMQVKVCPQGLPPGTLQALAVAQQLELNLLRAQPRLEVPGLLVMDMDSTVIQMECIDEIAQLAGVGPQVSEV